MNPGVWNRIAGVGDRSTWVYHFGPDFSVEVVGTGHLSRHVWYRSGLNGCRVGHKATAEGMRNFIRFCWQQHLASLSGHEKVEYLHLGLATEEELISAGGAS